MRSPGSLSLTMILVLCRSRRVSSTRGPVHRWAVRTSSDRRGSRAPWARTDVIDRGWKPMMTGTAAPVDADLPAADPATMLRGRDILCFSHDWSGDPLSKTHLMRLLVAATTASSGSTRSATGRRSVLQGRHRARAFKKLAAAARPAPGARAQLCTCSTRWRSRPTAHPGLQAFNRRLLRFQFRRAMRGSGSSVRSTGCSTPPRP